MLQFFDEKGEEMFASDGLFKQKQTGRMVAQMEMDARRRKTRSEA
jgi:hypothetical protein